MKAGSDRARRASGATAFCACPTTARCSRPRGIITETFETAITWDRFAQFHAQVKAATEKAIKDVTGRPGLVTCRFTHVYPDGPAPYFSWHALGDKTRLVGAGLGDQDRGLRGA